LFDHVVLIYGWLHHPAFSASQLDGILSQGHRTDMHA